jgi:hypothetical protein
MADDEPHGDARPPEYYVAQYCEENVWHLCRDGRARADDAHVAFISNRRRSCALWAQRAATDARAPVVWDYHVILFGRRDGRWLAWDLDSRLPCPADAVAYLRATFPADADVPAPLRPRFRLVPRATFLAAFASDRSHMRLAGGGWLAPPPSAPPVRTAAEAMNLFRFVDTERPYLGTVVDLAGLYEWLAPSAAT